MSFFTSTWRLNWVVPDPRPKIRSVTFPQPPPVLKFFGQQLAAVQSLINFDPSTQVHLMAYPTQFPTSPISSEGSTVLLFPDRDPSPRSPDHGGHTTTVEDRPKVSNFPDRLNRYRPSRDRQIAHLNLALPTDRQITLTCLG